MLIHETICNMTDEQVALLHDVELEEVPAFRELALAEAQEAVSSGHRIVGLVLEIGHAGHHWAADEDEMIMSKTDDGRLYEVKNTDAARLLGVSVHAIDNRRMVLKGYDNRVSLRKHQAETRDVARHHRTEWTKQEEETVMTFAGSITELALILGRTYMAIAARRVILRKREAS